MKDFNIVLNESEIKFLKNTFKVNKSLEAQDLLSKIEFYQNAANKDNSKYIKTAIEKINTWDASLMNDENFLIDDDAQVSSSKNGAYVQCWMWVENAPVKKTRKRAAKNG